MKSPRSPAARRTIARYDGAPRGDRLHVRMRWWTCPIDAVEAAVPAVGRVLEVGCGHGLVSLYLAECRPGRTVVGIDVDVDKIDIALQAAEADPDRAVDVRFERVDPERYPDGEFDAVVICDVLYLLPVDVRRDLIARAVAQLAPGGTVVIKEADQVPRWKSRLATAQELLATRVLRITEGEQVEFAPPSVFADQLRAAGLEVDLRRVDHGYPHPHVLVTGRRPEAG